MAASDTLARALERGADCTAADSFYRIAWSPCGRFIACGDDTPGNAAHARVWHAGSGREAYSIANDAVGDARGLVYANAVGFAGDRLVVVTSDACFVHDAATGARVKRVPLVGLPGLPSAMVARASVSPLGLVALGYDDGAVRVLDIDTERLSAPMDAARTHVLATALSFDGTKVAAVTHHGECRMSNESALVVWDARTSRVLAPCTLAPVDHDCIMAWANRSDAIALVVNNRLTVVRLGDEGIRSSSTLEFGCQQPVAVAWSPDDATIACIILNDIVFVRADDLAAPPVRTIAMQEAAGEAGDGACIVFAPLAFDANRATIATLEYWIADPTDPVAEAPYHPVIRSL